MSSIPTADALRKAFNGDADADLSALGIHDGSHLNDQLLAVTKRAIDDQFNAMQDVLRAAEADGRELRASEQRKFDAAERELRQLNLIKDENTIDRSALVATGGTVTRNTAEQQILTRSDSLADYVAQRGMVKQGEPEVRLPALLRSWVTGNRDGLNEAEHRAMAEGTASAGGVTVPTPTAAQFIDLARNKARVTQAGARIVPMSSQTLTVPRLTGASAPAWRNENTQIASGDLAFDAVTFTARSLAFEVVCSRELLEDSDPNVGGIVLGDLAAQVALELDRVALRGTGTAPEPRGVLNQTGVTVTSHGTDGTSIGTLGYDMLVDAEGVIAANNHTANGTILAPAVATGLRKAKATGSGEYLVPPADLVTRYQSNQVPTNLTVGTSTDCSEVYTADWSQLMIGMRTGPMVMTLSERYADMGQVGFIIWVRADVQLAHPEAFHVDLGVRP